jgi:hypothetical protein
VLPVSDENGRDETLSDSWLVLKDPVMLAIVTLEAMLLAGLALLFWYS